MLLKVLGSSSAGNCYILENDNETLIIECGIDFNKVLQALDFNLEKVNGAIFSHAHNDHSKFVNQFISNGINVFSSREALDQKGILNKPFAQEIKPLVKYKIGNFNVIPFDVYHCDANTNHDIRCFGFYIDHKEIGNILFVTDTNSVANLYGQDYNFGKINTYMIEANFSDERLIENIESGRVPKELRSRLLKSHLNIETVKNYLQEVDLSSTNKIILIHLSDGNSDEKKFIDDIQKQTGIPTAVASKGMTIPLLNIK